MISYYLIPELSGDTTQWWKLATIISCGTLAGAVIPELVKVFTSTESRHVREVVTSARRGRRVARDSVRLRGGKFFGAITWALSMVFLMSVGISLSTHGRLERR